MPTTPATATARILANTATTPGEPAGQGACGAALVNAMTVDVEDWFQVWAFSGCIRREDWDRLPCRVERNVERLLALFEARGVRATFFTLGWVAERYPQLVRRIVAAGHELASHGHGHQLTQRLGQAGFRADLARARAALEDAGGVAVHGYRAPSFSIGPDTPWAHDAIAETGHRYSSSVYPVARDHYGVPDAPRFAHRTASGVVELPATSVRIAGRNLPGAGGGFFRLLPYAVSRRMVARVNRIDRRPAIFYLHPWEIDPEQPRVSGAPLKSRLRHYVDLAGTERKLARLLGDFRWAPMSEVFAEQIGAGVGSPGRGIEPARPAARSAA